MTELERDLRYYFSEYLSQSNMQMGRDMSCVGITLGKSLNQVINAQYDNLRPGELQKFKESLSQTIEIG